MEVAVFLVPWLIVGVGLLYVAFSGGPGRARQNYLTRGKGSLEGETLTAETERGKQLFRQQCSSCHNLDAVNARGVTGPDLDEIGKITKERITGAIEKGGTGQKRMPADLLQGEEAEAVAAYVEKVASR